MSMLATFNRVVILPAMLFLAVLVSRVRFSTLLLLHK